MASAAGFLNRRETYQRDEAGDSLKAMPSGRKFRPSCKLTAIRPIRIILRLNRRAAIIAAVHSVRRKANDRHSVPRKANGRHSVPHKAKDRHKANDDRCSAVAGPTPLTMSGLPHAERVVVYAANGGRRAGVRKSTKKRRPP